MARIVILGGQGYLGGRAVAALRAAGADVHVASRSSARVVDVARPETYGALADADVVVDLVDTVAHSPDALLAWCVAQGKVVLEATSDSRTVERLAAMRAIPGAPGLVLLGRIGARSTGHGPRAVTAPRCGGPRCRPSPPP